MGKAADLLAKEQARQVVAGPLAPEDPEKKKKKKTKLGAKTAGGRGGDPTPTRAAQEAHSPEDLEKLIALISQKRALMGR